MRPSCTAPALLALCLVSLSAGAATAELVRASAASFSRPHDLVLGPGGRYLYVADVGNDAVKVLDPDSLATLGTIGERELSAPHDLAFDAAGRLLVADTGNDRVAVFELDDGLRGRLVASWAQAMGSPEGVSAGRDGAVYVSNAGLATVLKLRDGQLIASVGKWGDGPLQFQRPHDIEADATGRVLVIDPGNNRIQILDESLALVRELGGAGFEFNEPKYLALDERGWLYVADEYNDQIKIFDDGFVLRGRIGSGRRGAGAGELNKPEGVDVAGDRIWVSDTYNDRILLFRREQ